MTVDGRAPAEKHRQPDAASTNRYVCGKNGGRLDVVILFQNGIVIVS